MRNTKECEIVLLETTMATPAQRRTRGTRSRLRRRSSMDKAIIDQYRPWLSASHSTLTIE